jgi:hypothetical protein
VKHILSLGAGVQSSTLALMFAQGEFDVKLDAAIFADTQAEPQNVYDWLAYLELEIAKCKHPFPVYRVTAGNLEEQTLRVRTSKKSGNRYVRTLVPAFFKTEKGRGFLGRKCTAEFKVRVLLAKQKRLTRVPRKNTQVMCTTYIGISLDEAHRMKPSTEIWCKNEWPLIDRLMARQDCKDWMKAHGYPEPPRSACYFCPFHSDEEWLRLKNKDPAYFKRAVEYDYKLRSAQRECTGTARLQGDVFLHSSLVPLDKVQFTTAKEVDKFGNDCTGLCGV